MFASPAVLDLILTQLESLPNLPPIIDPEDSKTSTRELYLFLAFYMISS